MKIYPFIPILLLLPLGVMSADKKKKAPPAEPVVEVKVVKLTLEDFGWIERDLFVELLTAIGDELPDDNDFAAWTSDLAVLLGIDATSVSLSRAWVSVFHGQTVHVDVLTRKALAAETLIDTWREIPQLEFNSEATLSPVVDGSRGDIIQLGGLRVRARPGGGSRVSYWSVADDVRHATAANGIAISEILIKPDQ